MSNAQHNALSAIADVSLGRGKRGLDTETAAQTFHNTTLLALIGQGLLTLVTSYATRTYYKVTHAGFAALAA